MSSYSSFLVLFHVHIPCDRSIAIEFTFKFGRTRGKFQEQDPVVYEKATTGSYGI